MSDIKESSSLRDLRDIESVLSFIKEWCGEEIPFYEAINNVIIEKNISLSELMLRSRLNRNYGYNLMNGRRLNPSRDKVLALCVAARLSLDETQEILLRAKLGGLYYRSERDVWVTYCLNNEIGDVLDLNLLLAERKQELLNV